jgi:hypothetical protein
VSNANVVKLLQPGSFADPLTEVLRNGARALLAQAIEAEVVSLHALWRLVRPQNCGALDQTLPATAMIPNFYAFTAGCLQSDRSTTDAERAADRKLARLRLCGNNVGARTLS